jgi:hypothetical protein
MSNIIILVFSVAYLGRFIRIFVGQRAKSRETQERDGNGRGSNRGIGAMIVRCTLRLVATFAERGQHLTSGASQPCQAAPVSSTSQP